MTLCRFGILATALVLLAGCGGIPPYGAQVLLARTQQSQQEVAANCRAGDQQACAVLPFVTKALVQAQEDAALPWK